MQSGQPARRARWPSEPCLGKRSASLARRWLRASGEQRKAFRAALWRRTGDSAASLGLRRGGRCAHSLPSPSSPVPCCCPARPPPAPSAARELARGDVQRWRGCAVCLEARAGLLARRLRCKKKKTPSEWPNPALKVRETYTVCTEVKDGSLPTDRTHKSRQTSLSPSALPHENYNELTLHVVARRSRA